VPFLARLAAEAGEMTGVAGILLLALHNPVEVAECIASLDVIWGGNFVFGVGLGYREVEFDAFKVPRGQRLRRFEECLEIVKRLWTEDKVSVDTDVCTLTNVTLTCRPVQKPHPPIWFAANNDAAVRRAARLGDTWFVNPHATMASITRQMGLYRDELARPGKPLPAVGPLSSSAATASSWAARRNATSSSARAGKRSAPTSSSSARTGSACRWPTRWPACGS
jgi:alkanesulfonate monooxygenase SsuD/methylene tetrahydromethanopterin reductase-like flavin-dependent oxidoreductase (luciferase family)